MSLAEIYCVKVCVVLFVLVWLVFVLLWVVVWCFGLGWVFVVIELEMKDQHPLLILLFKNAQTQPSQTKPPPP